MKKILLYGNWLSLVVSILAALGVILYLILIVFFGPGNTRIIYSLSFSLSFDDLVTLVIEVFMGVGAIFVTLLIISHLTRQSLDSRLYSRRGAQAVMLLVLVGALLYFGSVLVYSIQPGTWEPVDTASMSGR